MSRIIALFDPRRNVWTDHFQLDRAFLGGKYTNGSCHRCRPRMNSDYQLELRATLRLLIVPIVVVLARCKSRGAWQVPVMERPTYVGKSLRDLILATPLACRDLTPGGQFRIFFPGQPNRGEPLATGSKKEVCLPALLKTSGLDAV